MTAQTILPANTLSSGGFNVSNSLRFNSGDSPSLSRTSGGSPSSTTKGTFSFWLKRSKLGINDRFVTTNSLSDPYFQMYFDSNSSRLDQIRLQCYSGGSALELVTNQKFRDISAWYNIILSYDSTPSTPSSSSIKLFVNGTQVTSFATATYPSQNQNHYFNQGLMRLSGYGASSSDHTDGYMAEVVYCDGQALNADSFGEFDEDSPTIWKPKDVSGLTFGTNGFYLDFEDSSALGNDAAGSNNFTVNNLTAVDQSTDTCTNNFATLNPLSVNTDQGTFSEGNLQLLHGSSAFRTGFASIGASQGKWYCEIKRVTATSFAVGVISLDFKNITPNITYMGGVGTPNLGYLRDGNTSVNGSETSGYESYANGDTLMIAMDLDNGKVYFGKNGNWGNSGDPTSGATGTGARSITVGGETWSFGVSVFNATAQCNFGSPMYAISSGNADDNGYGNFEYDVPAGYYSLNTKNLAEFG